MADRIRLAHFLSVPATRIPIDPEQVIDPKAALIDVARRSRKRAIVADMVPRPGSGRTIGPAYNSRLTEFVYDITNGWRPEIASRHASSLARTITRLQELIRRSP